MTYCEAMRTKYTCIAQRQLIHMRSSRLRSMIAARSIGETFLLLSRALKLMDIASFPKQRKQELRLYFAINLQTTYHPISCNSSCQMLSRRFIALHVCAHNDSRILY